MGNICSTCFIRNHQPRSISITHAHMRGRISIVSRASEALKDTPKTIVKCLYNYKEANSGKRVRAGDDLEVYNEIDDEWLKVLNISNNDIISIPRSFVGERNSNDIQKWFFENMTRRQAEKLLMAQQIRGVFLIRYSEKQQNCYVLSVLDYDDAEDFHVIHLKIIPNQSNLTLDSKMYTNLSEIVKACKENKIITRPCPKPQPHLWDLDVTHKKQWELSRDDLNIGEVIGKGHYAEVKEAIWKNSTKVAVKILKDESVSKDDILREATIMKQFRHPGLLPLYGVCSDAYPIFLVLEYMSNGDLLTYLREDKGQTINTVDLYDIALQISSGMEYIELKKLVHRDLAARNVLIGNNNIVKISDFGLARALDNNVYKGNHSDDQIAWKWTAPEAIFNKEFSTKSDVWSYGILLTELFTYGKVPYPELNNHQVIDLLKRGYRMERPPGLEVDSIYEIMLRCWREKPEERISFKELTGFFKEFLIYSD